MEPEGEGMTDLKPCPFCGNRHDLRILYFGYDDSPIGWLTDRLPDDADVGEMADEIMHCRAICMGCGAMVDALTTPALAERWNRRANGSDETAYETLSRTQEGRNMDFGDVIRSMKANPGKRFARRWWGGAFCISLCEDTETTGKGKIVEGPHIDIHAESGVHEVGWLASYEDMLAEDWEEVSE